MTKECTMKYQAFVRAAAGCWPPRRFLHGALAQTHATPDDDRHRPAPAHDRTSLGAVIMMDQPVLAQRESLQQAQARAAVDTRSMGAGPARVLRACRRATT
jgi:hypothetical protein